MRAIQQKEFGGPEVLELVDLPVPEPGDGEVLIRVSRAGMNFADTHQRRNDYLAAQQLPLVPGRRGRRACARTPAQRVVALSGTGGYAEYATAPEALTFPIPDGVDDGTALALLIQGLTAWHLYRTSGRVGPRRVGGDRRRAPAASGSLAVQLGKPMGAGPRDRDWPRRRPSATSRSSWAPTPRSTRDPEGLKERLIEANVGSQVDVVFEMAGGAVFDACLAALAPFGRLVTYGIASGEGNEVHTRKLMGRSRAVVGFWLMHCIGRPEMVDEALADLYARAARGELRAVVGATYPLSEARQAQIDLAERRTTGKVLLDPSG